MTPAQFHHHRQKRLQHLQLVYSAPTRKLEKCGVPPAPCGAAEALDLSSPRASAADRMRDLAGGIVVVVLIIANIAIWSFASMRVPQ